MCQEGKYTLNYNLHLVNCPLKWKQKNKDDSLLILIYKLKGILIRHWARNAKKKLVREKGKGKQKSCTPKQKMTKN
jgi:hypothetical protein